MAYTPLVSIIVPVYNVQDYLYECLESISSQTYGNIDVILVDDGSVDKSADICAEFCDKDHRFRLIRQKNSGLGSARNTGLSIADGDYVCFVDSDDIIHPDYIAILLNNLIKFQADISMCEFQRFENGATPNHKNIGEKSITVLTRNELLKALVTEETDTITVAWNKMVSKKWLNGFQFVDKWHEDEFMINEYIRRCDKAVITSAMLYEYRERPDSIMGLEKQSDIRHLSDIDAHRQRIQYFHTELYKSLWSDILWQNLRVIINWYMKLTDGENTQWVKTDLRSEYNKEFKLYITTGGLFHRGNFKVRLIFFFFCPDVYKKISRRKNNKREMPTLGYKNTEKKIKKGVFCVRTNMGRDSPELNSNTNQRKSKKNRPAGQ